MANAVADSKAVAARIERAAKRKNIVILWISRLVAWFYGIKEKEDLELGTLPVRV